MGPGIALLAAGSITAAGAVARGGWPSPRIFVGSAIAGAALLGVAQVSPEVASRFATLVVITALLTSGYDLAVGLNRLVNLAPTPPKEVAL